MDLDTDPVSVSLDYSLHKSNTDPGPLTFGIQLVEQTEDTFVVFRRDADTVILDKKDRFAILFTTLSDLNERVRLVAQVFCSIIEQVLQNLYQPLAVSMNRWEEQVFLV